MPDELKPLIHLRWKEKNVSFLSALEAKAELLASENRLHSGGAIKEFHNVLLNEFNESKKAIVDSAAQLLPSYGIYPERLFQSNDLDRLLNERKNELESLYEVKISKMTGATFTNRNLKEYFSLDELLDLKLAELKIEAEKELIQYKAGLGNNQFEILKNKFLNYPIVAGGFVVIGAVTAIITFINTMGWSK